MKDWLKTRRKRTGKNISEFKTRHKRTGKEIGSCTNKLNNIIFMCTTNMYLRSKIFLVAPL